MKVRGYPNSNTMPVYMCVIYKDNIHIYVYIYIHFHILKKVL